MTDRPTFRTLTGAADHVAQTLAMASQDPRGLTPLECAEMAHLLDAALVINAPDAPPPDFEVGGVVDLLAHRFWRFRT